MQTSLQALCFVGLVTCLGACVIAALHDIEAGRQRHKERQAMVRAAMRMVVRTKSQD